MRTSKERGIVPPAVSYLILAVTIALSTGCAAHTPLPAGAVKQITSPVVERETVSLTPGGPEEPLLQDTYYLGPGDMLFINVSGKPEFSTYVAGERVVGSRIDGSGNIHIPIVGAVKIAGSTVEQAQEKIRQTAAKYLKDPWVVAEILEYRAKQVFVFGAVRKPGPVPMMPAGLTLAQAIATAELRDAGYDLSHVRIIRSLSATRGELIVVDVEESLRGDTLPFPLKDGDIIYVPKNALGTWNDAISEMLPSLQFVSSVLQPFVQIKYLRDNN